MGTKFGLLVGAGLGYVFGTRAGRERYEQIKKQASKIRNSPAVSEKMDTASQKMSEAVRRGTEMAADKVTGVVKERVFGQPQKQDEYVDVTVVEVEDYESEK